ncbi:protein adenylyltransferase SelO [Catenovulum maritimum]|uniref:Protein nucleotidyltransferase YdiU n=1 Tax=Catenovulum maritimum TaxID=1513271 RepID=A0A0J8JM87_9ALTE|nr:YdiU family protein [Catenovulum maritimum]KMT65701.1 hypothetical protein XM47_08395 [Catenovulum maritimum]
MQFNNTYLNQFAEFCHQQSPNGLTQPKLVAVNPDLAEFLNIPADFLNQDDFVQVFSGNKLIQGMQPNAQKYTGHQFGQYNPQLGDGRGLLLGEVIAQDNQSWDLHLKGSGITPFSRGGDGRAVLRSSIREFLASEALFNLGIPTSRALALTTGEDAVYRETEEKAAMVTRVCPSHIRFGHFEYFYYTQQKDELKNLVEFTIQHHFPDCAQAENPTYAFLQQVVKNTAEMVAKWQAFGFCHGVMNSDNMSILGITFDYGPYAFMDAYQSNYICNHSDHTGRYAYNKQPNIALWNLNCLAHALSDLLPVEDLREILTQYETLFVNAYAELMRAKLGLMTTQKEDQNLVAQLLVVMEENQLDWTNTFRFLSNTLEQAELLAWFGATEKSTEWINAYKRRLSLEKLSCEQRFENMKKVNPKFILRNYLVQQAIEAAESGDYNLVNQLFELLKNPFAEQETFQHFAQNPPEWAQEIQISCSS